MIIHKAQILYICSINNHILTVSHLTGYSLGLYFVYKFYDNNNYFDTPNSLHILNITVKTLFFINNTSPSHFNTHTDHTLYILTCNIMSSQHNIISTLYTQRLSLMMYFKIYYTNLSTLIKRINQCYDSPLKRKCFTL